MCIIAIKNKNIKMWDDSIIKVMFKNNPDGAGFMYAKNGKVYINKGFMKVEHFLVALKKNDLTTYPVVLHFRIGTHGGNTKGNTHPFPLTCKIPLLQKTHVVTDVGIVHNGIINSIIPRKKISDTMEYIATVLYPLYMLRRGFYKTDFGKQVVSITAGSKLAFLDKMEEIHCVGDFIIEGDYTYSNGSYKAVTWMNKGRNGFDLYDGYADYYDEYDDDENTDKWLTSYDNPMIDYGRWCSTVPEGSYTNIDGHLIEIPDGSVMNKEGIIYSVFNNFIIYFSDGGYTCHGSILKYSEKDSSYYFIKRDNNISGGGK